MPLRTVDIMPSCRAAIYIVLALSGALLLIVPGLLVSAFHIPGIVRSATFRPEHARPAARALYSFHRERVPGTPGTPGTVVLGNVGEAAVADTGGLEKAQETLKEAVSTRKVSKEEVAAALQSLSEVENFPALQADDVEGTWELVFSTQLKSGYMPVRELIQFYPSRQKILIDTKAGPLPLGGVRGECSWEGGAVNELVFTISTVQFGPVKFAREPKRKTYQFFLFDGEVVAAKSSAGTLSLLLRISE